MTSIHHFSGRQLASHSPVQSSSTRSASAQSSTVARQRFQGVDQPTPDSAEQVIDRRLSELLQQEVQFVHFQAAEDRLTVLIGNQRFTVEGLNRRPFGTMPVSIEIKSLDNQEQLRYTGRGCFSPESVRYQDPDARNNSHVTFHLDVVEKMGRLLERLRQAQPPTLP